MNQRDFLVAKHIMGWELINYETGVPASESDIAGAMINDGYYWDGLEGEEAHWWQPSARYDQAFMVLEKLGNKDFKYTIINNKVFIQKGADCFVSFVITVDSLPSAIVNAALSPNILKSFKETT